MTRRALSPKIALDGGQVAGADTEKAIINDALARHRIGFARLSRQGLVIERHGAEMEWLPAVGRSCFEASVLAGLEQALRELAEGREEIVALPNVGIGPSGGKTTITIAFDAVAQAYSLVGAQAFGASETELMLARERRERRLADEQAEAARRRARINEALYRDIVESGADLVLRLRHDRTIAFANGRVADFCGRALPALLGADVGGLLAPDEGSGWDALAPRQDCSFEQRLTNAAGENVWIWWRAAWLGAAGGPDEYQAVGRDITLLKKLQAEIELAHAEARSALVVRERLRIAHDLHDTIVQALVAVVAQLRAVSKVATRAPDRILPELRHAEEVARAGLESGRAALGQVRFQRAGLEGLEAALRRAAARLAERTGLNVACELSLGPSPIVGEAAEILYRIVEEALRNVESHAQASCVTLKAHLTRNEIEIVVSDDGRGFDPGSDYPGHYGLSGMHEQARMIGGRLTVRSERTRGSAVIVRAPVMAGL